MVTPSSNDRYTQAPTAAWMPPIGKAGLVSVIVPTYNRAHFLPDAIQSVVDQTYRPIELLVVDDGSTDNTRSVVDSFRRKNSVVNFTLKYYFQKNQGAQVARNRGLTESHGEFIQFLDSDDILHPQKIELQTRILNNDLNASFVWTPHARFQDRVLPDREHKEVDSLMQSAERYTVRIPEQLSHPESGLYRRELCRTIGPWNEDLERWQDWEYCFRVAVDGPVGVRLSVPLYFGRDHDTGSIGDLRFGKEGVNRNLITLAAIDRAIDSAPCERPELRKTAFRLYLNTLHRALASGTSEQINVCMRRSRRQAQTKGRFLRIWFLRLIYRLTGPVPTLWVLKTYSQIRAGVAPAGNNTKP